MYFTSSSVSVFVRLPILPSEGQCNGKSLTNGGLQMFYRWQICESTVSVRTELPGASFVRNADSSV